MVILVIENGNAHAQAAGAELKAQGHAVYACANYPDEAKLAELSEAIGSDGGALDLLLFGAPATGEPDGVIGSGHDDAKLLDLLTGAIYGMEHTVESLLPLLRRSETKRIGMITEAASSIGYCEDRADFGHHMALAGLNMAGRILFNRLRPEGFTFRWYCADGEGGVRAARYMQLGLCYDPKEPYTHSEENRLVMRDRKLREIPW